MMFKVGDEVTFKRYKGMPDSKLDIYIIHVIDFYGYGIKFKTTNSNGEEIYIHSQYYHKEEELMVPIKQQRKLKLDAIQKRG